MKLSELKVLPKVSYKIERGYYQCIENIDITKALHEAGWTRLPITFPLGAVKLDEIMKEWIKENGYFKWSEVELDKLGFQALLDLTPSNSVDAEIIELVADNIQKLLKVKGAK